MALTACRECAGQVSSEASACPHCGVAHPASDAVPVQPPTRGGGYWFGIAAGAVVVGLGVAWAGYSLWESQQGITVDGQALQQQIVEQYRPMVGNVTLVASCPASPRLRKDKTVDCKVGPEGSGGSSPVFITPTDNSGHFRMQLGDPSVLIHFP